MKYQPGFPDIFMSPLTGKTLVSGLPNAPEDYTYIGGIDTNIITSPILIDIRLQIIDILSNLSQAKFILQKAKQGFENSQALDELSNGFLQNTNGILSIGTPGPGSIALDEGRVFVGDSSNLASQQQTITIDNEPDLTHKSIWRGNASNRPVESTAVTDLETAQSGILTDLANLASIVSALSSTVDALTSAVDALETGLAAIGGFAAIALLQTQVLGLIIAVASLGSRVTDAENEIDVIQGQITDIYNRLTGINTRIDNLSASFVGDVQGNGLLSAPINLELMLTLDEVKKAEDTVDLNNNNIINLVSENVEQLDALNAKFLWDLMHDNVGVVWA